MNVKDNINTHRSTAVSFVLFVTLYAYLIRLLIVYIEPEWLYWTMPEIGWPALNDQNTIINSSTIFGVAAIVFFLTLCVSQFFQTVPSIRKSPKLDLWQVRVSSKIVGMLLFSVLLASIFSINAYLYGIGRQGQFNEELLPYKIAGIVVYGRAVVVPLLLLSSCYWAESCGKHRLSRVAVLVLFAVGLVDMFFLNSRGAALKNVVLLVMVWWLAGFRTKLSDRVLLLSFGIVLFIAIQIITSQRLYEELPSSSLIDQMLQGIGFVLFRVTGIEHLMVIQHLGSPIPFDKVLDVVTSPRGVAGYYTTELLGVDENLPQTFAPSGLGWLYLVGGLPGVMLGAGVLALSATSLWCSIGKTFDYFGPVFKAHYLFTLLIMISEGVMGQPLMAILIVALTLKMVELFRRMELS